ERLRGVDDGEGGLQVGRHAGHASRPAGAANEWVAERVVVLGDRGAERAVLLAAVRVGGFAGADRVEVRERGLWVTDALDDRYLPLVVELLDPLEVLVQADVPIDGLCLRRRGGELRTEVAVLGTPDRNDRLQADVPAAELDHHEHL